MTIGRRCSLVSAAIAMVLAVHTAAMARGARAHAASVGARAAGIITVPKGHVYTTQPEFACLTNPANTSQRLCARLGTCVPNTPWAHETVGSGALGSDLYQDVTSATEHLVEALVLAQAQQPGSASVSAQRDTHEFLGYEAAVKAQYKAVPWVQRLSKLWFSQPNSTRAAIGAVYIPVDWQRLTDDWPWKEARGKALRRHVCAALTLPRNAKYTHFTVMMQGHLAQFKGALSHDPATPHFPDFTDVVVFSTRGADNHRPRFAVPLLHVGQSGATARRIPVTQPNGLRRDALHFSGACTHTLRCHMVERLKATWPAAHMHRSEAAANGLEAAAVRETYSTGLQHAMSHCGQTHTFAAYTKGLAHATCFLFFPGTMPASFHLSEGIVSGALPVVVYQSPVTSYTHSVGCDASKSVRATTKRGWDNTTWLPYRDVGVAYTTMGYLLHPRDVLKVHDMLADLSSNITELKRRQAALARVQRMYTVEGVVAYLAFVLARYRDLSPVARLQAQCGAAAMAQAVDGDVHSDGS